MHQKLKFDNPFRIQFTIQEIAFRLCTKQSSDRKSQKDKQLKFAPRLDKQLDQDAFFYSLKKMQTKHSAMKG